MTRRPPGPGQLADALERAAKVLRQHGTALPRAAEVLAARGWPTTSGAAGNGRGGTAELTSVEAAADQPGRWAGVDDRLDLIACRLWADLTTWQALADDVMAHGDLEATERKNRQPGSGPCLACTRDVPGMHNDRLRSGFCNACRLKFRRQGHGDRMAFIRMVQREQAEQRAVQHVDPTEPQVADARVDPAMCSRGQA